MLSPSIAEMVKAKKAPGFVGGHFKKEYYHAFGVVVESESQRRRLMKERNLEECGDKVRGDRSTISNNHPDSTVEPPDLRTQQDYDFQQKEAKIKERVFNDLKI